MISDGRRGRSAAGRLLEPYRDYLLLVARGFIGPALRAKTAPSDAVQETLLKAYERLDQFRGSTEKELTAWLRQILTRHLVDVSRRYRNAAAREVRRERALDALSRSSVVFENFLSASGVSPSRGAAQRELGVILADALAELSDDHREVLFLRHFEGLDWPEIGMRMGRSRKAAGMLWTRALEKIRPLIERQL
ncbi:MAG: sigma-70 family RNA polymerase sigma factor [Planctomycetota bacterium]